MTAFEAWEAQAGQFGDRPNSTLLCRSRWVSWTPGGGQQDQFCCPGWSPAQRSESRPLPERAATRKVRRHRSFPWRGQRSWFRRYPVAV